MEGDAAIRAYDTLVAGNEILPAFMEKCDARLATVASWMIVTSTAAGNRARRPRRCLCLEGRRTVSVNLTLQYDQVLFILEPTGITQWLARKQLG